MKPKYLLLGLIALICGLAANAADTANQADKRADSKRNIYRNVFVEAFGPSSIVGVHYEQRFYPGCKFGFRVGAAYDYASNHIGSDGSPEIDLNGVSFPVGVNFITGGSRSKFEIGANIMVGVYNAKHNFWPTGAEGQRSTVFNSGFSLNIGYRYQRPSGFLFRVGWAPQLFAIGHYACVSYYSWVPHLGFGYTF